MSEKELIEWFKNLKFEQKGMVCLLYSLFFHKEGIEQIIKNNEKGEENG